MIGFGMTLGGSVLMSASVFSDASTIHTNGPISAAAHSVITA